MIFLQNILTVILMTLVIMGKNLSYNFIEYKFLRNSLLFLSLNDVFQNCSEGGMCFALSESIHVSYSCSPRIPKGRILCSTFRFIVVNDLFKLVSKYEMTR